MALDLTRLIFGLENYADAATLTCADQVATLPVSRLQTRQLGEVFRTQSVTPANTKIAVDFGASKTVDVIALMLHNLRSSATATVEESTDGISWSTATGWTVVMGVGATGWTRSMLVGLQSSGGTASRYLRLCLSDSGNPAGYLESSRLFMGAGFQPPYGFSYGVSFGVADASETEEAPGGDWYHYLRNKRRSAEFSVPELSLSAMLSLMRMLDMAKGRTVDALVIPFPNDASTFPYLNIWGTQEPDRFAHPYFASWQRSFRFTERVTAGK